MWVRLLACGVCYVVPLLVPASWGEVKVALRPLSLLRVQGLHVTWQKGVLKNVRLKDVCVFRETEWYRTWIRWICERSFPIGIRGIEVTLSLKHILAVTQPESPVAVPKTVKVKRRRKLKLPSWAWRSLFRILSGILLNITDVQLYIEDIGLRVMLEHLAVVFKSNREVPCRAALKAKNLTCTMTSLDSVDGDAFRCFELSDIAMTASIKSERNALPELHSLKVALGTIGINTNNQLIEEVIELTRHLPKRVSTPKVKSTKSTKSLKKETKHSSTQIFPSEIGGGIHKLCIIYTGETAVSGLNSSFVLSNLHAGVKSSSETSHLDIQAGIKNLELCVGIASESASAVFVKMPDTHIDCTLETLPIQIHGKAELGSIVANVDDDLIWNCVGSLLEHISAWDYLLKASESDLQTFCTSRIDEELQTAQSSTQELLMKWREDPLKDSPDQNTVYRKLLDSGDLGLLEEAEEEDPVEELVIVEEEPAVVTKTSIIKKLSTMEWDLTVGVREAIGLNFLRGSENVCLLEFTTEAVSVRTTMKPSLQPLCALVGTLHGIQLKTLKDAVPGADSVMEALLEFDKVTCSAEGSLKGGDSGEGTLQQSCLALSCHVALSDIALHLEHSKLERLLHLAAEMHTQTKSFRRSGPTSVRKSCPHANKQKPLKVDLQGWSGEVAGLRIVHETQLQLIECHSRGETGTVSYNVVLDLSKMAARSGTTLSDFQLDLESISAGWRLAEDSNPHSPFFSATGLQVVLQKQHALVSVRIFSSGVKVEAEIDTAILALQIVEDMMSLKTDAQSLLNLPVRPPATSGLSPKIPCPASSSVKGIAVRVPSSARLSLGKVCLDVTITETVAKLFIADSDILLLTLTETTVTTPKSTPQIHVEQLNLDMNGRRVTECSEVQLKLKGPCFLTELNNTGSDGVRLKRALGHNSRGASFDMFPRTKSTDESSEDPTESEERLMATGETEVSERGDPTHKWRTMGCASMGISDFVEEDYLTGDVLDFFSIDVEVDTAVVIVPHDQHIGRLILFAELWMEAIKDLVKAKMADIKRTAGKATESSKKDAACSPKEGPADLIDVSLSAKNVVFRLDPHPMESWLSLHSHHLRDTVILRHAWENLIRNLQDDFDTMTDAHGANDWASQAVFLDYYRSCKELRSRQESPMFHQGACMCITAENVSGLVLVGDKKSPNIIAATIRRMKELDRPISNEVTFARVQPIFIAATASHVNGHFAGLKKPAAVVEQVDFHGLIARGRQLTHDPSSMTETYKVGRWHEVQKQLPVKGARPPMKVYTDMVGKVIKLDANGGIGLEPVFCQLSKAFNRLIPPSQVTSDGTLPEFSGHTLQSWDKIRYTWRGKMTVEIHQLAAAVAADTSCSADVQTPRIEVQAERLSADVVAGGVHVNAVNLEITLFDSGLRSAPEAPLRDLPLCVWPHASIQILYTWLMPHGRSPLLHHAFPIVDKPDPAIQLQPVDLFELFVGEGYTMEIHADFDEGHTADDPIPKVIMGEDQIRFLVRFFQLMEDAPIRIRGCWKRGSYFLKKDKKKKCITPELPTLLHRIVVSLKTSKLAVEHFVWDSEDPSDHLLVTCDDVRFNGTWAFLDKIENADALREGRFVIQPRYREVDGVWRQVKGKSQLPDMQDLAVAAKNVEGFVPEAHTVHPILTRETPGTEVDLALLQLLKTTDSTVTRMKAGKLKPPDGTKGRILTAKTFNLKQRSGRENHSTTGVEPDELQVLMPSGEIKRPLHIQLADVKLIMPLEVRNAVVGVYMHMLSAFTGPPRSAALKEQKITDSIPQEQLQERREQDPQQRTLGKSTDSQLLRVLLQQDEEGRGPSTEPKRSASMEENQKVDPLPPRSKMILQMELENVQLSCLSSVSMGGLLVCLQSGVLHEYFSEEEQIRTMTLHLNQVQAYHMDTKIDPMNPVRWLDRVDGAMVIPSDSHDILTRIVQPFEAELSDLHLMLLAQARNPGRAAEELKIHSSRIEAVTDSDQFEMLVDVINSVATPAPPDIKLLRDTILGPTGSALEDTSEAISEAKAALKETYRGFNDLRQQAYELSLLSYPERTEPMSLEDMSRAKAKEFLMHAASENKDFFTCRTHIPYVQDVLDEQVEVARKVCYQSTCTVQETRRHVANTNKHKKLYKSMKMQLAVDNVTWQLMNKDTTFMLAEIKRVLFKSFHNKDLSGESSVSVYRIELRDTRGSVGPGSGLDSGVVLSVLEPTGSDEEVLRGLAIRGAQTSSHIYYEHIEAWVHRFGFNVNEEVATELAGFFFPGSDVEIVRKREEDWAKFGDNRKEPDIESESSDRMLRRDSMTTTSFEIRPRASSFLDPLVYSTLPERDRRLSFSDVPVTPPEMDPLQLSATATPLRSKRRRKKGLLKPRKTHFVHVRFNKIVTHVTYVGRPFSFKGLTLTLGMSEYNSLEGNWRGLFKKYRNGIIASVIKSIATHEGRTYDPSLAILGDSSRVEKSHGTGLLGRSMKLFKRREKTETVVADEEDEEMKVDVCDEKAEQAGRDLLLGKM